MPLPIKRFVGATLAAAACALVPSNASAGVVVAASGPSASDYPVGKKIGNSERIVLRAGDTLTVLDGNGTRVLRGAGTYSLGQQAGPNQPLEHLCHQLDLLAIIKRCNRGGTTVITIMHDLNLSVLFARRIVALHKIPS